MEKFILVLSLLALLITPSFSEGQSNNCDPIKLGNWLVQRQLLRDGLQPLIDYMITVPTLPAAATINVARRVLEDLPRPACADDLYNLTIYFDNTLSDFFVSASIGSIAEATTIFNNRIATYNSKIDTLFFPLQEIAGIDVSAEAAKIEATYATPEATP